MKTCHVNEVCYFLYEVKGKCKEGGGGGGGRKTPASVIKQPGKLKPGKHSAAAGQQRRVFVFFPIHWPEQRLLRVFKGAAQ